MFAGRRPLWNGVAVGVPLLRLASSVQMPPCEFKPKQHTGMGKERALEIRKSLLSPALTPIYRDHVYIHQGHMQWLFDTDGKRYLDMFAGIVTVSVGHCHPKVVKAAKDQMDTLWHTTNIYMHPGIHEYAERLTSLLPGDLKVLYLTNSGSEANDLALLMARLHTRRFDIISLRNAYHGGSPGYSMGATSLNPWIYEVPGRFGFHQTMNPDVYRGLWGGSKCRVSLSQVIDRTCDCPDGKCSASDKYIEQMEDLLRYSLPKRIAGFIAEYAQGVGAVVQMPHGFLPQAYELVRQRGGVCIADEVQTGFGRTGDHFWGFQSAGVMPDIVTMAKGIGNGFPMAAVVTTPEIAKSMSTALHANTFGGNPMACAVGTAVLDVIEEEGIQERAKRIGGYFIQKLMKLRDNFDVVGDVRGQGLMLGLELVADRASRSPLPVAQVNKIWEDCKEMGLLIGKGGICGSVYRIKPPMCITEADVDFAVAVLQRSLEMHQERVTTKTSH